MPGRRSSGFTLLELMLVIAVLAILIVMAIPGYLNSKITANEASAITTVRTLVTANTQYLIRHREYAPTLTELRAAGYFQLGVADPTKAGYIFGYTCTGVNFTYNADPMVAGNTGNRHFFVDSTGMIRVNDSVPAGTGDTALDP
jgi:prepilin-type N-terminal cleavage/methylation domain-containing protein